MNTSDAPLELELLAYAEGRIDSRSARGLEIAHYLEGDAEARRRVRAYAAQDRAMRRVYDPVLSQPIPDRLRPRAIRARNRHERQLWTRSMVAAMCTGVLVWLFMFRGGVTERDGLESFVERVAAQIETPASGESSSLHAGLVQPPGPLPDFSSAAFALSDVRSVQDDELHLWEGRYRDPQGRQLRLFVGSELAADRESRSIGATVMEQGIVYWKRGQRYYALTGDFPDHVLAQFAATGSRDHADGYDTNPAIVPFQESMPATDTRPPAPPTVAPGPQTLPTFERTQDESM